MKILILLGILFCLNSAHADINPCADQIETAIDSTIGKFYTENGMNYDDLIVKLTKVETIDTGYVYTVGFEDEWGYIQFSKNCDSFSAEFSFRSFSEQDI